MKDKTEFKIEIPCWFPVFGHHNWTEWAHEPCHKYRKCTKCTEYERKEGWHRFTNWSKIYYINVYDSSNRTVKQQRQKRTCTDCNEIDERMVGY